MNGHGEYMLSERAHEGSERGRERKDTYHIECGSAMGKAMRQKGGHWLIGNKTFDSCLGFRSCHGLGLRDVCDGCQNSLRKFDGDH